MSCGVGCRCSSDPAWLWLWHSLVATAPIQPLTWEHPYTVGMALKRQKQKKNPTKHSSERFDANHSLDLWTKGCHFTESETEVMQQVDSSAGSRAQRTVDRQQSEPGREAEMALQWVCPFSGMPGWGWGVC